MDVIDIGKKVLDVKKTIIPAQASQLGRFLRSQLLNLFFRKNASIKRVTAVLCSSFIFMKAINCGKGIEL